MRKISFGLVWSLLALSIFIPSVAWGDVITPAMEDLTRRKANIIKSINKAKEKGAIKKQLQKAKDLDRFCSRSYLTYGPECLNAKMTLADVYWANGQLREAKNVLAPYCAAFERSYNDGLQKIKRQREQEKNSSGLVSAVNMNDHFSEMEFYKVGPGAVDARSRLDMLVFLSDLCKALGQSSESSKYLKQAETLCNINSKKTGYRPLNSFAEEIKPSRTRLHPMWTKAAK